MEPKDGPCFLRFFYFINPGIHMNFEAINYPGMVQIIQVSQDGCKLVIQIKFFFFQKLSGPPNGSLISFCWVFQKVICRFHVRFFLRFIGQVKFVGSLSDGDFTMPSSSFRRHYLH